MCNKAIFICFYRNSFNAAMEWLLQHESDPEVPTTEVPVEQVFNDN